MQIIVTLSLYSLRRRYVDRSKHFQSRLLAIREFRFSNSNRSRSLFHPSPNNKGSSVALTNSSLSPTAWRAGSKPPANGWTLSRNPSSPKPFAANSFLPKPNLRGPKDALTNPPLNRWNASQTSTLKLPTSPSRAGRNQVDSRTASPMVNLIPISEESRYRPGTTPPMDHGKNGKGNPRWNIRDEIVWTRQKRNGREVKSMRLWPACGFRANIRKAS